MDVAGEMLDVILVVDLLNVAFSGPFLSFFSVLSAGFLCITTVLLLGLFPFVITPGFALMEYWC